MATAMVKFINGLIVAALLSLFGLAGAVQAADDDAELRSKALALNDVTGDNPILGEIKTLVADSAGTRKLLRVAVSMAKEKEQPFNYNGAYILARTALQLRELEASKVFYRICAEQASKLQSVQKLREAYGGMMLIIEFLYREKKFEECIKLSQEFLETLDRQGVAPRLKASVLREMCRALVKQGKVDEANRLVDNLLKAKESDWRNLELKAWLQHETGHTEDALKTYEKVLGRITDDEEMEKEEKTEAQDEIRERIIRLLVKLGKADEASRVMEDLLKGRKDDLSKFELKARLQQIIGRHSAALKTYEELLERIPKDDQLKAEQKAKVEDEVREHMIRLLVKLGKVEDASRVMEDLLRGRKDDLSKFELKARLQQIIGRHSAALKTYEELLERIPKDDQLKAEQKAKVEDEVREQMIRLLVKLGKLDDASRVMQDLLKGKKEDLSTLELKAPLQQLIGQYSAAAKTYEELLERITKEESLKDDEKAKAQRAVRYALSNVYVEMNLIDKATEQLKMLLAEEPESPSYNNDLGYIWADHDQNLDEAEKLIRKAIDEDRKQRKVQKPEEDKDNAAYLDSLGWVLFKQKKYEEAKKYLLEAIKAEEGNNIEIYDHLADVYMALGDKTQAIDTWRKALSLELNSLREQHRKTEVEKKLKANE